MCDNLNLSITNLADLNDVTEVSDSSVDLDLILEELLECGDVEDLVACWLRGVDDELVRRLASFLVLLLTNANLASTEECAAEGGKEVMK